MDPVITFCFFCLFALRKARSIDIQEEKKKKSNPMPLTMKQVFL